MPLKMDEVVHSIKNRMHVADFNPVTAVALNQLTHEIITEQLNVPVFWSQLLRSSFSEQDRLRILQALRNEAERSHVKEFLKSIVPPKIKELCQRLLSLRPSDSRVATIDPKELNLNPDNFTETFAYDDTCDKLTSSMESNEVLIRVYHSLDHTLGAGSEATLYIALLGLARRISEDDSLPLRSQYAPLRDANGHLIVSKNIMVAKKPHVPKDDGTTKAKVDVRRHERGSINLRDLTLPHFYTEESKKALPGLWSLPRFADFGDNKCLYYEYVEGIMLHNLLDVKEFDILARLITLKHMAQTLHYIHSMGYIHSDLKPQNVIIANSGIATIIDFGLTEKYLDSHKTLNEPMQKKIVGTPLFMSPEQVTKNSKGDPAISEIRYVSPFKSQDELALVRRSKPEAIVVVDGLEFKEVAADSPEYKTPFFFDSYLKAPFFSDTSGHVVPVTGKSDVFSLGINILLLTTGTCHLPHPTDTKRIIQDLCAFNIQLCDIKAKLPDPFNVREGDFEGSYKERLEQLIMRTLEQTPQRRPSAHDVAEELREIIWSCFGGDHSFFSTFDDECTYLRNRLYRRH
jgi:serine/threonine protein kinase